MEQRKQTRQLNKKMLERLIIIHNAIKSGLYPDNLRLQRLYCEQTGYSKVGEATINWKFSTYPKQLVWAHLDLNQGPTDYESAALTN